MAMTNRTAVAGDHIPAVNNGRGDRSRISWSALQQVILGVAEATNLPEEHIKPVHEWISKGMIPSCADASKSDTYSPNGTMTTAPTLSLDEWRGVMESHLQDNARDLAYMILCVAFLREECQHTPADLGSIRDRIHNVLTSPSLPQSTVSPSAQGFLDVPLFTLKDGNIVEQWRLYVWLPSRKRHSTEIAIHSHHHFAESWTLAGEAEDQRFKVEAVEGDRNATHEFPIRCSSGDSQGQPSTPKRVYVTEVSSTVRKTDANYAIPQGTYHATNVAPELFHVALFFFYSNRGSTKDASILYPAGKGFSPQVPEPAELTPKQLASMLRTMRSWEESMEKGQQYAKSSNLEFSMREFEKADKEIKNMSGFPNPIHYRLQTKRELAKTYRRLGKYDEAIQILERARPIEGTTGSVEHVRLLGELGVALRGKGGRDTEASKLFEEQYAMAKEQYAQTKRIGYKEEMCRAVGNLGTGSYESALAQMQTAIKQLNERVELAQDLKHPLWESIGSSRLSACYLALNKKDEAKKAALEGLRIAEGLDDPIALALSRFFYGRVLLHMYGRREEASQQFNPSGEKSTPAIALCKEPSALHVKFLDELIQGGADLTATDEDGYTALHWAVFNRQEEMESLVVEKLREQVIDELLAEAKLQRGYRKILQEKLRPKLTSEATTMQDIRQVYDRALEEDQDNANMFDRLHFVWYPDFKDAKRIPRSNRRAEGFKRVSTHERSEIKNLIFFSYRWLGKDAPDDENNTQYRRMVRAAEEYRARYGVAEERLGIWVDYACIDQDDPTAGIAALPMILIQCDAVISLVGNDYYSRGWCTVEVRLIQTLVKSYDSYRWLVHKPVEPGKNSEEGPAEHALQNGPEDMEPGEVIGKSFRPSDRGKLLFLERQSKLLGRAG